MVEAKTLSLLEDFEKALQRLEEVLVLEETQIHKDATVKRFEFTFELAWKLMQAINEERGFVERGPKANIRRAAQLGLIDNPSAWIQYLKERNLVVHVYDIDISDEVYEYAREFAVDGRSFLRRVKSEIEKL